MAESTGPTKPRKYKSGAQKRKERGQRTAAAKDAVRTQAQAAGVPLAGDSEVEQCAVEFDDLGAPDLEAPDLGLGFVRRAQLIAFGQVLRSRRVPPEEKWRLIDKMSATIGMTQNRGELEALAERLETTLAAARPAGAVNVRATQHAHARPATSRGGSGARGPRPLPGSPAEPDQPKR
jgi:hypothetical protein